MDTSTKLRSLLAGLLLLAGSAAYQPAMAQLDEIGSFMTAGAADGELLAREYIRPFGESFGSVMNTGWVNRGDTHGTLGFNLQVRVGAAQVPDAGRNFDLDELDFSNLRMVNEEASSITPTVSGPRDNGPLMEVYEEFQGQEVVVENFNMPEGTGVPLVPAPMISAGVGVPFDSNIMLRYVPTQEFADLGAMDMYGFGVKHGLNQWLPGGAVMPVSLSLMAAYNHFGVTAYPDVTPREGVHNPDPQDYDEQQVLLNAESFTINALAGRNLPFLNFYAGLGYEVSSTRIAVEGPYPITTADANAPGDLVIDHIHDPVDLDYDGINNFRAMAGVRANILILDFFADVTLAQYPVYNAGIGISFR